MIERLPYLAGMGFDVLYLPPIHPIGRSFRKGKNNALVAAEGDVGSPWAIGGLEGGHKAIHPELGTLDDFHALVRAAESQGIALALDVAFQTSPDHPYVREHPEWFLKRPDGSIQYAENPPKKYEDIYPFHFESEDWPALAQELKSVFEYWTAQGVRIYRVDNPHTKPFAFWEWAIGELKRAHPDLIFLAEAFTRPKVMRRLAKLGFSQSYTYFTWRNTKEELTDYFTELTQTEMREYFRPNAWPNTPDILHEYLQNGGRPAFMIRLILAATLCGNYGVYGPAFEHCQNVPRDPGTEEYLHSEKYQIRRWNLERPDSLAPLITRVNRSRRDNPALHRDARLVFHPTDNAELIAYSKSTPDRSNIVLTVVNLDPHHVQAGWVTLRLDEFGIDYSHQFQVHDLLSGARYLWHGPRNFVQLDPANLPAHLFVVRRRIKSEQDFDYFL
jgi:starch synthase (maltosyl-transferring)